MSYTWGKFIGPKRSLVVFVILAHCSISFASKFSGSLGFSTNSYSQDIEGNYYFGDLEIRYDNLERYSFGQAFSVGAQYNDAGLLSFSVHEAFLNYKWSDFEVSFGRRILSWSQLDSLWGLGAVNNRENFTFFDPGQEGLVGISAKGKFGYFRFQGFGSMLYIPELNPSLDIDESNQTVGTRSPWGLNLPTSTKAVNDDVELPIFYNVDMPATSDILLNYSLGGQLAFDFRRGSVEVFAIRKPENKTSVAGNILAEVLESTTSVNVNITPQIFYHNVFGAQAKYRPIKGLELYGSVIHIDPENLPTTADFYQNLLRLYQYTSVTGSKKEETYAGLGASWKKPSYYVAANYIARVSAYDIGEDLLVERPRWNQAINLKAHFEIIQNLFIGADFKFDMLTRDRLSMIDADYYVSKSLKVSAGVHIIGTDDDEQSFWSKFKNNDSVHMSMHYIF